MNYKVIYKWARQYDKDKKLDKELNNYINQRYRYHQTLNANGGVNIREAFYGGRTNNLKFYHECNANEEIKYLDFCCLYPYVLKTMKFPLKHPEVISENFDFTLKSYFGFAKCKILPPRRLYIPILPKRINGKLMYTLCRTCAELQNSNPCNHTNDERLLIGTWTTIELIEALARGYKIIELIEVVHYKESSSTLFTPYINMWLKIKQEASGWPNWCKTKEQKLKYIEKYFIEENIKLEYDKIEFNPALRFIAKIMLNSFWEKLGQRPNLPQTLFIWSYKDYYKLATDPTKKLTGEVLINEDTIMVNWAHADDSKATAKNYALAIAAFVPAHARIKLCKLMEKIEKIRPGSLLYYDTDSVIFVRHLSDPVIECGDYLGNLTDEILKDYGADSKCIKFVSLGPKNYGYEVKKSNGDTKVLLKVKGISLSEKTLNIINFKMMIEMAIKYGNKEKHAISVPQLQFRTDKQQQVFTKYIEKIFQPTSMNRAIKNNDTYPYGL